MSRDDQQKSSINRVNDFITNIRRARTALSGARTAASFVRTARAVNPFMLPSILTLLSFLAFAFIFLGFFGGGGAGVQNVKAGTPQDCITIGGTCQAAGTACALPNVQDTSGATCPTSTDVCCAPPLTTLTCPSGDYASCLLSQMGITVVGASNVGILKLLYDDLAIVMAHPLYLQMFKARTPTITISSNYTTDCVSSYICATGGWATTAFNGYITIYQAFFVAPNTSADYQKYLLIHESGHTVGLGNDYLQTDLYNQTYNRGFNLSCFNGFGFLKTYPMNVYVNPTPRDAIVETFAESVADTQFCNNTGICPGKGRGASPISNFPSTCSYVYNYIYTKVFGR